MSKRLVYAEDVKENILGALDIMREVSENSTLVDTISNAVCSCIDLTDTAESEKRGKWVNCGGVTSVFAYECSVCGQKQDIRTAHCSGCGAKMGDE